MASTDNKSSSTSVGWLGKLSRSMSGTLLCAARSYQANSGLELAHLGAAHVDQRPASIGSATASQPVAVPGLLRHSATPSIAQPGEDGRTMYTEPAPVAIPSATPQAVAGSRATAAAGNGRPHAAHHESDNPTVVEGPESVAQPAGSKAVGQHLGVHHPLREPLVQAVSVASSGEGLPSALDVPSFTHARHSSDTQLSHIQLEQVSEQPPSHESPLQQQQQQTSADQAERQQKVRWLPGLRYGSKTAAAESAAAKDGQVSEQPAPGSQMPDSSSASSSRSSIASASATAGSSKPASKLPPSGNAQLDKYLNYLLRGAHPHSFMYYPSWGMSEDGCAAIGEFLRHDRRIKVMTLSENSIRDEGCELIAEGLAANRTLTVLDLSNNKISDTGAIALAEALHLNNTLKELKLSNNKIGDEGAEALAAAFAGNSTLKRLHLTGNPLTAAQKQVVEHVLKTKVYKMPNKVTTQKKKKSPFHLRKHSSLQFHIELTDSEDVLKSSARHRLPPADVVAALTTPTDTLENSLAMQVAHLLAELAATSGQQLTPPASSGNHSDGMASQTATSSTSSGSSSFSTELVPLLALRLAWRGYEVVVRTSVPAADANNSEGLAVGSDGSVIGLKHTFLRAVQPGLDADASPAVVIDPYFREQFKIPHMTDRYRSVLAALPRVLVLAESRLYHLVEALSSEMTQAFQEAGMACPPWRDVQVLLEKWLSTKPLDVAVDSDATLESLKLAVTQKQNQKQ